MSHSLGEKRHAQLRLLQPGARLQHRLGKGPRKSPAAFRRGGNVAFPDFLPPFCPSSVAECRLRVATWPFLWTGCDNIATSNVQVDTRSLLVATEKGQPATDRFHGCDNLRQMAGGKATGCDTKANGRVRKGRECCRMRIGCNISPRECNRKGRECRNQGPGCNIPRLSRSSAPRIATADPKVATAAADFAGQETLAGRRPASCSAGSVPCCRL